MLSTTDWILASAGASVAVSTGLVAEGKAVHGTWIVHACMVQYYAVAMIVTLQ